MDAVDPDNTALFEKLSWVWHGHSVPLDRRWFSL